jgi:lactosylceramide 4-alpha-galactosyltransferase
VTNSTREECPDIAVIPPTVFFNIDYSSWELIFDESRSEEALKKVEESYGVHLWNKFSSEKKIIVGSKQTYGLLAEKYCPQVYRNCRLVF